MSVYFNYYWNGNNSFAKNEDFEPWKVESVNVSFGNESFTAPLNTTNDDIDFSDDTDVQESQQLLSFGGNQHKLTNYSSTIISRIENVKEMKIDVNIQKEYEAQDARKQIKTALLKEKVSVPLEIPADLKADHEYTIDINNDGNTIRAAFKTHKVAVVELSFKWEGEKNINGWDIGQIHIKSNKDDSHWVGTIREQGEVILKKRINGFDQGPYSGIIVDEIFLKTLHTKGSITQSYENPNLRTQGYGGGFTAEVRAHGDHQPVFLEPYSQFKDGDKYQLLIKNDGKDLKGQFVKLN